MAAADTRTAYDQAMDVVGLASGTLKYQMAAGKQAGGRLHGEGASALQWLHRSPCSDCESSADAARRRHAAYDSIQGAQGGGEYAQDAATDASARTQKALQPMLHTAGGSNSGVRRRWPS